MKKKYDKTIYGIVAGIILPVLGFFISYLVKGSEVTFNEYMALTFNPSLEQRDILIFCMIPNMFFFYFTNFRWNMYEFTKGLVGMTLILGAILFYITM